MGDIKVRRVEDWVLAVHRDLAGKEGQSLEEHMRKILLDSALVAQKDFAADMEMQQRALRAEFGEFSDSGALIRQERWDRG